MDQVICAIVTVAGAVIVFFLLWGAVDRVREERRLCKLERELEEDPAAEEERPRVWRRNGGNVNVLTMRMIGPVDDAVFVTLRLTSIMWERIALTDAWTQAEEMVESTVEPDACPRLPMPGSIEILYGIRTLGQVDFPVKVNMDLSQCVWAELRETDAWKHVQALVETPLEWTWDGGNHVE